MPFQSPQPLMLLLVGTACSTAEHCQEMVRQLAKTLAARLDPPLGEKVRRRHCWACSACPCVALGLLAVRFGSLKALELNLSCSRVHVYHTSLPTYQPCPGPTCCQVDMSEEEDELQSVVTQCLSVLLLGIETKLEAGLAGMARINWAGMEMVRRGNFWGVGLRAGGCAGGLVSGGILVAAYWLDVLAALLAGSEALLPRRAVPCAPLITGW